MNEKENTPEKDATTDQPSPSAADPGIRSIYEYLTYGLSLPERALRSTSAMVGGALRESASLLVPQAFRDSKSYTMFVDQMLDFVANDIGGVKAEPKEGQVDSSVDGYVAKKTVSNFVELAGMAMLHVSPMTILAITSDIAYGSNAMLKELSVVLKKQGVIPEESTIDSTADLLAVVGETSGDAASVFDMPPLTVEGLTDTVNKTTAQVAKLDPTQLLPQKEMQRLWDDMYSMAAEQDVDVFDVSSAMTMYTLNQVGNVAKGALTTVRVTGEMLERHVFNHYWEALGDINNQGIYSFVGTVGHPYVSAVWHNFSMERETMTEDVLSGKLAGRIWKGFTDWYSGGAKDSSEASADSKASTSESDSDSDSE